ncbi:hypothetical protein JXI42_14065 [bacterium]|nr:hypothetical protein [bacterium]
MNEKTKSSLVPYEMVSPGWEAIYTDEKFSTSPNKSSEWATFYGDDDDNEIRKWSVWTISRNEDDWNEEMKYLNSVQEKLSPLNVDIRWLRIHIGSFLPCDSGFPVTLDEILNSIGQGQLPENHFHAGCWMGFGTRSTQPLQVECIQIIENILTKWRNNVNKNILIEKYPYAKNFIDSTYKWLGNPDDFSELQKLLLKRMLLPFDFFARRIEDHEKVMARCFGEGSEGERIDTQIAELAGLPKIYPNYMNEYREALESIIDPEKKEIYKISGALAHSLHGLSDCHHNTFHWIENWIYGIGNLKWRKPTGREKKRMAELLFSYAFALDKWLLGIPKHFLLLDLEYIDAGFNPKNEILRVYAYLGNEKTLVKEWLVACLWVNLCYSYMPTFPGSPGLFGNAHRDFMKKMERIGLPVNEWMSKNV